MPRSSKASNSCRRDRGCHLPVPRLLARAFAAWDLITDRDFINWWHDRWHHPVA
jgi:hypothetical protein